MHIVNCILYVLAVICFILGFLSIPATWGNPPKPLFWTALGLLFWVLVPAYVGSLNGL